ncbi:ribonuclease H [Trifolium pratense]|uniref:Ribonuclease H n=1 Tax=Trifolium pratense TaxID=57577 RepID=A0A2K3NXT0_TRIPR|nr:ribonuclease H [Trifolium pratense]
MAYPKAQGRMGFRDLHTFNLAMIAKQGWNIITKPHTLMAKIYKARYFPDSSLFESQIGHNPSYAWRGIWKARHILMNGCRWIIGSGTNIKVMSDPWLREKEGAWIQLPQVQGKRENLTQQEKWSSLWKIKHLLWRICKGCFPTRTRLQESAQARQAAGLEQVIAARLQHFTTAPEVILAMCHGEDKNTAGQFAMLLWILWNNRNDKVWNNSKEPGRSLGIKATQLWHEWFSVQNMQQQNPIPIEQQQSSIWQKPPMGWYKCNVDAGFYNELNKTTAGWCLRDHLGRFVRAGTSWKDGKFSLVEGESARTTRSYEGHGASRRHTRYF